jgi:hypothetical protein
VNETVTDAAKDLAGIGQVPAIVSNTSSEAGNLQSVSDTVDTFSTLLTPLKAFNTIINDIANIRLSLSLLHATNFHIQHSYMKVAMSICTRTSKVDFFLSHRRRRVDDVLVTDDS